MKYCRFCGMQIEDDAKFCPHCGNSTEENSMPTRSYDTNTQNTSTSGSNYHWAAVCALIFGILGGWLAFVFGGIGLSKCTEKSDRTMCIVGIVLGIVQFVLSIVLGVLMGLGIIDLGIYAIL